jgi:transcriptional regulator with XRE-family HTH domain
MRLMKLREYLAQEGITTSEFARRIGLSQPSVSRLMNGHRAPSLDTILAIERVTKGKVKASDFAPGKSSLTITGAARALRPKHHRQCTADFSRPSISARGD